MSELVLIKTPEIYPRNENDPSDKRFLAAEKVVGITVANSKTLTEYGYKPTGREAEEAVTFNGNVTEKIAELYERCRVPSPEDRRFHNCHLLAWYALGRADDLRRYDHYFSDDTGVVSDELLETGKAYSVMTSKGIFNHSLLGIDRPGYNLSVIGDNNPMVVSRNSDLVSFYKGTDLVHVVPDTVK